MGKIRISSDFLAYSDAKDTNAPKDQTKVDITTEDNSFSALLRHKIEIADATVDQVIAISSSNSEHLLIYTDQEITIKIDGSGDSRTLKPKANGIKTLAYLERGDITSLLVSNASGNVANLDIISVKL